MDITILRQCGTRRHDDPIYYLQEKGAVKVEEIIYTISRHAGEAFVQKAYGKIPECFKFTGKMLHLLWASNSNIIVRASPYDLLISYLLHLKRRNEVVFHNSWPYWDRNNYVKKVYVKRQIEMWEEFLNGIKVVGVTRRAAEEVKKFGAEVYHIPHSVNTEIFKPMPELKKGEEKRRILFVGYMVEGHNIPILLNLAKRLKDENVEFWFVGRGKLAKDVVDAQRKYPVKYFSYIENRKELAEIYAKSDIFVIPSGELFGIVLIEAMACGLPVIAVDSVGPREIINDGADGFLLQEESEDELLEKLQILINDGRLRKKMGENGRKKAVSEYDIKVIADKWKEVLEAE